MSRWNPKPEEYKPAPPPWCQYCGAKFAQGAAVKWVGGFSYHPDCADEDQERLTIGS